MVEYIRIARVTRLQGAVLYLQFARPSALAW